MNLLDTYSRYFNGWLFSVVMFILLLNQCFQLFAIPTEKYLKEEEAVTIFPVSVVEIRGTARTSRRVSKKMDYFVKYSVGEYEVLLEASSLSDARSTLSKKEPRYFTLYLSTKDPEVYRLVSSSTTLKKALQEERNPILIQGGFYFLIFLLSVRDIIVKGNNS